MTAAIFLMALLGCGEGEAPCRQITVLEAGYESRSACVAATEAILAQNSDYDYPVLVAQCQEAGTVTQLTPKEVRLPAPERTPLFRS